MWLVRTAQLLAPLLLCDSLLWGRDSGGICWQVWLLSLWSVGCTAQGAPPRLLQQQRWLFCGTSRQVKI